MRDEKTFLATLPKLTTFFRVSAETDNIDKEQQEAAVCASIANSEVEELPAAGCSSYGDTDRPNQQSDEDSDQQLVSSSPPTNQCVIGLLEDDPKLRPRELSGKWRREDPFR